MQTLVEQITSLAEREDVPVLGTAEAAVMDDEPPGARPSDLLPGAKGLLCFGLPVPAGVYQQSIRATDAVWRSQSLYYRRLDGLSVRFAALLEESGERALPVFGCAPFRLNARGEIRGSLNQLRMGEAAGLGIVGRSGLLLHARYGPRLMLGGVVTTAALPVMRRGTVTEPGCPPDCRICVDVCPVGAVAEDGSVDTNRCLGYAARTPLLPKLRYLALRRWRPQRAARLLNLTTVDEHTLHACSRCVVRCPYAHQPVASASGTSAT